MVPRVVGHLVVVGQHVVHEVFMGHDALADLEERGMGVVLAQEREHPRRPARVGTVVEREGDHSVLGLNAEHRAPTTTRCR